MAAFTLGIYVCDMANRWVSVHAGGIISTSMQDAIRGADAWCKCILNRKL